MAEWATWTGYSDAERIAIEFAERFEGDVAACDEAFFERLAEHFDEGLVRDLTFGIGGLVGFYAWPHLEGVSRCLLILFGVIAAISISQGTCSQRCGRNMSFENLNSS